MLVRALMGVPRKPHLNKKVTTRHFLGRGLTGAARMKVSFPVVRSKFPD
jgi:hypothetical protein